MADILLAADDRVLIFGACPPIGPSPAAQLSGVVEQVRDYSNVAESAFRHRVAEGLYYNLCQSGHLNLFRREIRSALEHAFAVNQLVHPVLQQQEVELATTLKRKRATVIWLDSPSLTSHIYGDDFPRHSDGFEIVVTNEPDDRRVIGSLAELGYRPVEQNRTLMRVLLGVARDSQYLSITGRTYRKIVRVPAIARHHSCVPDHPIFLGYLITLVRVFGMSILHGGSELPMQAVQDPSHSPSKYMGVRLEDSVALLCGRAYYSSFSGPERQLRYLYDVAALVNRAARPLNWRHLYDRALRWGRVAPMFYVLGQIKQVFGLNIPDDLLARLASSPGFPESDRGDMLPFLLNRPHVPALSFED